MRTDTLDEGRRASYDPPSGAKRAQDPRWRRAEDLTPDDIAFGVWSRSELDALVKRRPKTPDAHLV